MRYPPYAYDFTESELGALRQVCLVTLDLKEADERLSELYDEYGEKDDEFLRLLMSFAFRMEHCTKQAIMSEFARISRIRP